MRKPPWEDGHPFCQAVYLAAIQGICANPEFFGPLMQQSPSAAVEFADAVVMATVYGKDGRR